jgi:hypothetical protein
VIQGCTVLLAFSPSIIKEVMTYTASHVRFIDEGAARGFGIPGICDRIEESAGV